MHITVRELEAYLAHTYRGRTQETSLYMKLAEEMGEVAEVLNKRAGRKADSGEELLPQLAAELADIIHYAVAIAAVNDIDLEDAILEKDERASVKYGHSVNLKSFIRDSRK